MNKISSLVFAVMCLILGFALAIQFRSIDVNAERAKVELMTKQQLMDELIKEKQKTEGYLNKLSETEKTLQQYVTASLENKDPSEMLKERLEKAQLLAGLTDVKGEGIIVKIDQLQGDNSSSVYYEDILEVLNELRAAGAIALSINDERVISTTEVRKAGSYIVINNTKYSTPFTVKALGNPDTMEASLKLRNGIYERFTQQYGLDVKIEKSKSLTIKMFNGVIEIDRLKLVN